MKRLWALLLAVAAPPAIGHAAEPAALAIPGAIIYESALDTAPGEPWRLAKGTWELAHGVVRGSELAADKHGAVARLPNRLHDFILEYEFKFEGARGTSLSINAEKGHMARIGVSPTSITFQRDDTDHQGPDKAIVFARYPADLKPGTWHTVRLEMVGDTMYGQVDEVKAWGASELFKSVKVAPGFTVAGESVDFRNLVIREASLNPGWESVRSSLPPPGSQVAAVAGRAKPAAKAKATATSR
jgi:hypothetical protein